MNALARIRLRIHERSLDHLIMCAENGVCPKGLKTRWR